jgi:hypothetical protein
MVLLGQEASWNQLPRMMASLASQASQLENL